MHIMAGYFSLVLHAHLPFVRHPEHEKFLEENWLFEAITESYIPLIQVMDGWLREGMETRLTLTLTPTLCAMLLDPLLQERYARYLSDLLELTEKEIQRTHWENGFQKLALFYRDRLRRRWRETKKLESSALGVVQEVLTGLRVVKAFGQESREKAREASFRR